MRLIIRVQKGVCLCILLMSSISQTTKAQSPGELSFRHFTTEDGLSQSTVFDIFQDYEGYMWFGTQDGLNKYNGYEMEVYVNDKENEKSISYNDIAVIFEDEDKNLWFGTHGNGLNLYDRNLEEFDRFSPQSVEQNRKISGNIVYDITENSEGHLIVATNNGLSVRIDNDQPFKVYHYNENNNSSLSSNVTRVLKIDSKGNLWIGTSNGLNKYDKETDSFIRYLHDIDDPNSIGGSYISAIHEDSDGTLWIGTLGGGLNRFEPETNSFTRFKNNLNDTTSISDDYLFSIFEDSEGLLWIGTENEGIDVFDKKENKFYHFKNKPNNPNSLNNNSVYSIFESREGILWFGTFNGGLNIVDRKNLKFEHYYSDPYSSNTIGNNSVLSFLEDSKGNFWVGTDGGEKGGLNLFDRKTKAAKTIAHSKTDSNSPPSDVILQMLEDNSGNIWLGTYQGGVSSFSLATNEYTHYKKTANGLNDPDNNNDVFALYLDKQDRIWAGSNGGGVNVLASDRKAFQRIKNVKNGQVDPGIDFVRSFLEDSKGNLWLGLYGNGLAKLDRETNVYTYFSAINKDLSKWNALVLHEDRKGRIWVGTYGEGLDLLNTELNTLTNYSTKEGLSSNVIKGILEDEEGNLWISTNNGLTKFNPDEKTFDNYGIEDGLQSQEFNQNSYYQDSEGYMYFGGPKGFNRFHPSELTRSTEVAPIVFSDFQIFNKSVEIGEDSPLTKSISETEKIVLPHTASVITFSYAALNFKRIKGYSYAYQLEGFDEEWNYVNEKRTATYTNLDPGTYTLKAKVANSDGYWNPEEASITLIITPPFWKTIWFYVVSILIFIGILFVGYRWRTHAMALQNRKLEVEVAERTLEISEKNTALEQAIVDLNNTKSELIEIAHKAGMADIATGVLHNVGNILNSVNTSATVINETLKGSRVKMLSDANTLLKQNMENIEDFILNNPKGKKLLEYYLKLEEPLRHEQQQMLHHSDRLADKIVLITDVVTAQQSYATSGENSKLSLKKIVEDTLNLFDSSINKHEIEILKELEGEDSVIAQKTKIVHILVNFIKNAKEAMLDNDYKNRVIKIKLSQESDWIYLDFYDSGYGISSENLAKMFTQGFSTKNEGHGFGLHSSANYMKEMGGTISVKSEGINKGTTFTLGFKKVPDDIKKQSILEEVYA